jgi:hypothetical protein
MESINYAILSIEGSTFSRQLMRCDLIRVSAQIPMSIGTRQTMRVRLDTIKNLFILNQQSKIRPGAHASERLAGAKTSGEGVGWGEIRGNTRGQK